MNARLAPHAERVAPHLVHDESVRADLAQAEVTSLEPVAQPDERLVMAYDCCDPRCERVRALRTELMLRCQHSERADIIALLSPCASEGRSLLAADLAIAFAQTGLPTLLVDADLRRPQQHTLFNTDNKRGLADAIVSGRPACMHTVHGVPCLMLLTAGDVPDDPLQLLSSRSFATHVDQWREHFRFVVIDTAPIANFADGLAVANLVGRVLVLSRAQRTPYREMQLMLRRLAATRAEILGAVISHF
jgi:receptor protein-tyrosine kinase